MADDSSFGPEPSDANLNRDIVDSSSVTVSVSAPVEKPARGVKPILTHLAAPNLSTSADDPRFEMSKSSNQFTTATELEMKRNTLDEYFRCISQPFDLKALLDVVTHGVTYESQLDQCEGKRGFFQYHKDLFERIDKWKRNYKIAVLSAEANDTVTHVRWKCTYGSNVWCGRSSVYEGSAEFEFEEFKPHGIESASPVVLESPRDAGPRRHSTSQPPVQNRQASFGIVPTYRISKIRMDAKFNPSCMGLF